MHPPKPLGSRVEDRLYKRHRRRRGGGEGGWLRGCCETAMETREGPNLRGNWLVVGAMGRQDARPGELNMKWGPHLNKESMSKQCVGG